MVVRERFNEELNELQNKLLEIGNFSIDALGKSLEALETGNVELALKVMEDDTDADIMEDEINDFAILLIAKQQPVAIDLRRIIVAIKIATDIERIADFATNIAKAAIRIGNEPLVKPIEHIKMMHEITSRMLKLSLEAFDEEDIIKAKKWQRWMMRLMIYMANRLKIFWSLIKIVQSLCPRLPNYRLCADT